MDPRLATILVLSCMFYAYRRESRESPDVSSAVWIPTLWLLIIFTRAVSTWLGMFKLPGGSGGSSVEDGSMVDAMSYFILIALGARVIIKRNVRLADVISRNRWFAFYLLFCLISIVWSEFPFVAIKRWVKELGHPIMVLVIFSEANIEQAISSLLKRVSFVVIPISVLFIKYYPLWGRGFDQWSGRGFNTGITENKNCLGWDMLILEFFFIWYLILTLRREKSKSRRYELLLCVAFLSMGAWLLSIADSKTPLGCLLLGVIIMLFTGLKVINKKLIGVYILAAAIVLVVLDSTFDLYNNILAMIGRDPTLTTRTFLWAELWKWPINPIIGTGFESFWLGDRKYAIWRIMEWEPTEAHNGYLETYLNLGAAGFTFMMVLLAVTYRKSRNAILNDSLFGRFRLGFFFAFMLYNWTEASMGGLHPVWFTFFLISMDYSLVAVPDPRPVRQQIAQRRQSPKLVTVHQANQTIV